jgi:translocation and assembly module TamB
MDESDILSYLVLGRPLNEASESEGESLYKEAATSISLAGSGAIARSIGGVFELSEVNIESGDTAEDTALVLGKSLTPRLYVRYVQGLVDNTNMFQVRYRLSNKWTLQTESGTRSASGADLIYSFER